MKQKRPCLAALPAVFAFFVINLSNDRHRGSRLALLFAESGLNFPWQKRKHHFETTIPMPRTVSGLVVVGAFHDLSAEHGNYTIVQIAPQADSLLIGVHPSPQALIEFQQENPVRTRHIKRQPQARFDLTRERPTAFLARLG